MCRPRRSAQRTTVQSTHQGQWLDPVQQSYEHGEPSSRQASRGSWAKWPRKIQTESELGSSMRRSVGIVQTLHKDRRRISRIDHNTHQKQPAQGRRYHGLPCRVRCSGSWSCLVSIRQGHARSWFRSRRVRFYASLLFQSLAIAHWTVNVNHLTSVYKYTL